MIKGFIKNSFVDYPGKVAATIFTGGCNFSCPFCHNGELVLAPGKIKDIPDYEIMEFLEKRKGLIDAIVISGGEPTLHPGIWALMAKIKDKGFLVKLDTNGYQPRIIEKLLEETQIDFIAMDIKNAPDRYAETAGLEKIDIQRIFQSVKLIQSSGIDYEFRTTIMKEYHSAIELEKIGQWLNGSKKYVLQNYKQREGQVEEVAFTPFEEEFLESQKEFLQPFFKRVEIRT